MKSIIPKEPLNNAILKFSGDKNSFLLQIILIFTLSIFN